MNIVRYKFFLLIFFLFLVTNEVLSEKSMWKSVWKKVKLKNIVRFLVGEPIQPIRTRSNIGDSNIQHPISSTGPNTDPPPPITPISSSPTRSESGQQSLEERSRSDLGTRKTKLNERSRSDLGTRSNVPRTTKKLKAKVGNKTPSQTDSTRGSPVIKRSNSKGRVKIKKLKPHPDLLKYLEQTKIDPKRRRLDFNMKNYLKKLQTFKNSLPRPIEPEKRLNLTLRRRFILRDTYNQIKSIEDRNLLRCRPNITFEGEEGRDRGGLTREWFTILSNKIFDPEKSNLFKYCSSSTYVLMIKPPEGNKDKTVDTYWVLGRLAGIALYHGELIKANLSSSFFKMVRRLPMGLQDVKDSDPELFNFLKTVAECDPESLELRFNYDEPLSDGTAKHYVLKPGGDDIPVTEKNKHEYIRLMMEAKFVNSVIYRMSAFITGLQDVIPLHLLNVFDDYELEVLLCGEQEINIKDWRKHTQYDPGYSEKHETIKIFWKVVEDFDNKMKQDFLQFATGSTRVPMGGFKYLKGDNRDENNNNNIRLFRITPWGTTDSLPVAHTCFNRIDLPPYEDYETCRIKLVRAIQLSEEGFWVM